jgi:hypothetical protein
MAALTLTAVLSAQGSAQALPDARELIDRYANAIGGDAWKSHTSAKMKGVMELPAAGMRAEIEAINVFPSSFMMKMEVAGMGAVQSGYDGTTAWMKDPMMGARLLTGPEADQIAEQAEPDVATRRSTKIASSETVEKTTMNGQECFKVKHTWKSGRVTHDCFGVTDGLIVASIAKQASAMGEMELTTFHSEYKDFGGVKQATLMTASVMGQEMRTRITSWEWDVVKPEEMEPPADIKALLPKKG